MRLLALLMVPLLLATALPTSAAPDGPARLIVGFAGDADAADLAWLEAQGAEVLRAPPRADFVVVQVERARAFATEAAGNPEVRYVEEDVPLHMEFTPADPLWIQQWGPAAISADDAWDHMLPGILTAQTVVYGVVDTGVDYRHPDIVANMWVNDDPPNGVDDDGNGYVDDTFGWDCSDGDNDPTDGDRHGTHVAGIAAARISNGVAIAGVSSARIMALKVFGSGSFASAAAECIRYGADNGARVLGMSWFSSPSAAITSAITYAWGKDAVLMKSAGNQGNSGPVTYPGTLPEVIAVSALNSPGTTLASYSSTGAKVELSAPGTSILSTVPNGLTAVFSGTSMAQPHASGVALLILAKNPGLTNQQVRDLLAATADDLGAAGRDNQFGFGRVNALRAVLAA